jgi:cell division inhibitor SepF
MNFSQSRSGGGMLDSLKSKLGMGTEQPYDDEYYDEAYDDDYDDTSSDYADYGEYGYDPDEDDQTSSTLYGNHARSTRSGSRGVTSPRLVSIDDVRARTQVPESLNRDPLPPRHVTSASSTRSSGSLRGSRMVVDGTLPSTADSIAEAEAISALPMARKERSESLDTLFASTASDAAQYDSSSSAASSHAAYDPYEAYAGAGVARHNPTRSLTVLKPMSYGEAERVAKSLKSGDAVILALGNTPEPLVKRLLDFSFGVASALDASVDCIANKVFVLTRGGSLTAEEMSSLRNQGVI